MTDLDLALGRQAVCEWRDRQIVTAAAIINRRAVEALAEFELEVEGATAAETLFNPTAIASARVDALMLAPFRADLRSYLAMAADELGSIGSRLRELASAFREPGAISLPEDRSVMASPVVTSAEVINAGSSDDATSGTGVGKSEPRGLAALGERLARNAASFADSTGAAADSLLQDKLGLKNRLRTAALHRVEEAWMGGTGEPLPVLAQIIALIEITSDAARGSLS